ncbi:hypothetical protein GTU79_15425 [Sodalis ligni]|nr:hypothetical protein GTU79_15425 [Sodalis ligni]
MYNKLTKVKSYDNHFEGQKYLDKARELKTDSYEKSLKYCIEHEDGNCGELAYVTYALCHKHELNPKLATFESDGNFNHAVVRIKVNDNFICWILGKYFM